MRALLDLAHLMQLAVLMGKWLSGTLRPEGLPSVAHLTGVLCKDTNSSASPGVFWCAQQQQLTMHLCCSMPVTSVAWSKDGHMLLSGSLDKSICLWDLQQNIQV